MDSPLSREELSKKLREKMSGQKMKRSSAVNKKAFLEKCKIPEPMMDQYMKALQHQSAPQLMTMMNQLSKGLTGEPTMQPPAVSAELFRDVTSNEASFETLSQTMPETAQALKNMLSAKPIV